MDTVFGVFYNEPLESEIAEMVVTKVFRTQEQADEYVSQIGDWWKYSVIEIPVE